MRESTVFYRSFYEAIKELDAALQAQVYSAIFEYALNYNEVQLTGVAKTVFTLIKPQLDANHKRYQSGIQPKQKRNISESEAKHKRSKSEVQANVNVNDNVNVNQNENDNLNDNVNEKKKRERFVAPSFDMIKDFMIDLNNKAGNIFTADKILQQAKMFYDHYESNGWIVGRVKMKSWEASARKWLNNTHTFEKEKSHTHGNSKATQREQQLNQFRQQVYTPDDQLRDIQQHLTIPRNT